MNTRWEHDFDLRRRRWDGDEEPCPPGASRVEAAMKARHPTTRRLTCSRGRAGFTTRCLPAVGLPAPTKLQNRGHRQASTPA